MPKMPTPLLALKNINLTGREKVTCQYEPEAEVVGVYEGNVHVRGYILPEDEESTEATNIIMSIPLYMYLEIQRTWLQAKQACCDHYQHYCGVMLGIDCTGVDTEVEINVAGDWIPEGDPEDDNGHLEMEQLPVYQIVAFDPNSCDPEHG